MLGLIFAICLDIVALPLRLEKQEWIYRLGRICWLLAACYSCWNMQSGAEKMACLIDHIMEFGLCRILSKRSHHCSQFLCCNCACKELNTIGTIATQRELSTLSQYFGLQDWFPLSGKLLCSTHDELTIWWKPLYDCSKKHPSLLCTSRLEHHLVKPPKPPARTPARPGIEYFTVGDPTPTGSCAVHDRRVMYQTLYILRPLGPLEDHDQNKNPITSNSSTAQSGVPCKVNVTSRLHISYHHGFWCRQVCPKDVIYVTPDHQLCTVELFMTIPKYVWSCQVPRPKLNSSTIDEIL